MARIQKLPSDVVNRMAAGEVVVRPCNAIKELLENSLDAGSKSISVSFYSERDDITIQVQDDGKGIAKDDMEIVCERFTTSKLAKFEDLQNMQTFGFRGEALASLSLVSKMTIVTKTVDQPLAYQANYQDCKLIGQIKASAGKNGTIITAKELFYNCPSRKKAFIGTDRFKDEVSRVMDMITKYAIQRPDVTFAFKTTSSSSFRTSATGDTKAVISSLLGKQFADNLIEISCESNILRYKISGYISKPISAATSRGIMDKKTKQRFFSLFVNGRSVECPKLKHAIDSAYSSRDVICMCTHLSLEIDPARVDVNVHPTKQSVIFIGMDDVVDELQYQVLEILNECMEGENVSFNSSQPSASNMQKASDLSASQILKQPTQLFMIPSVKKEKSKDRDSIGGNKFQQPSASPKNAAYFQNRTDSQERRLEQFFRIGDSAPLNDESKDDNEVNLVEFTASNDDVESTQFISNSSSIRTFRLKSLDFLKTKIENEISPTLIGFFKNHIFVGFIGVEQCLFQFGTALYLINISEILEPFFYQISLSNFGNFGSYRIGEPGSVRVDALLKAAGDDMWELTESINNAEKLLSDNAEMLNNYFSIELAFSPNHGEISLVSIPCIMNGLQPQLERLPNFVSALLYVNYEDQASCFHEILMAIANFYVPKEEFCNGDKLSGLNPISWKSMLRDRVLPYLKNRFKPPAILSDKKIINPLVDAHDLYKVFERC